MSTRLHKGLLIVGLLLLGTIGFASTPQQVSTVNIAQNGFTVVWYTDSAEAGSILFGTSTSNVSTAVSDVRGSSQSSKIHMVQVTGLNYDTDYYFAIQSGLSIDTNGGNYYHVKTAQASLSFSPGNLQVNDVLKYLSTTSVTTDALVFAQAQDSSTTEQSLWNAILFDEGSNTPPYGYSVVFMNFKSSDGSDFGSLGSSDTITLYGWTESDGFGGDVTVNAVDGTTLNLTMDRLTLVAQGSDTTPPANVTNPSAVSGVEKVILSWTESTSTDNAGTRVVRSDTHYPATITDGVLVYAGMATSNISDSNLTANMTYYYTLFAYDGNSNYASGVTVSAVPIGSSTGGGAVLDDFEDGDLQNAWGFYGYNYDDATPNLGGNSSSTVTVDTADGANGTGASARLDYTLGSAYQYPFAGFGTDLTANNGEVDISQYTGVSFYLKGSNHPLCVVLRSREVTDDNDYCYAVTSNSSWTKVEVPFEDFSQAAWGISKNLTTILQRMSALQFRASSQQAGETGWFKIDEITFVTKDFSAPAAVTNTSISVLNDNPVQFRLTWTPSASTDNAGTRVLRKTGSFSSDENDGTSVYEGTGSSADDTDSSLTKNVTYYYSFYAYDNVGNFSSSVQKTIILTSGGPQLSALVVSESFKSGSDIVTNNDYVDSTVTLTVYIETTTVSSNAEGILTVDVNGSQVSTITFNPSATVNAVNVGLSLSQGTNVLTFTAEDWDGQQATARTLTVKVASTSEAVGLKEGSKILPYPMPYNPDAGNLRIAFELTKAADVTVYMYDLQGHLVYRNSYTAYTDGGKSGYNEVTMSGVDAFGSKLSNGIYIVRIVSDQKVLGTGKILVVR